MPRLGLRAKLDVRAQPGENLLRLHHVLKAFERQAKDRSRGYQDHAEIQRCCQQVEDREREVLEELFAALMEPGNLALEIFERSTPPGGFLWWSHPRGSFLLGKGLSRNEGEQRGRSEEHTSERQSPCNLVCR